MTTPRDASMVFALALALGGGGALARSAAPPAKPHEVVVSVETRTLSLRYAPGDASPDPAQIAALNVLLATGDLGHGDPVRIERAPAPLAQARAVMLSSALAREGLSPTIVTANDVPDGELRLRIDHAVARAPGCPDWSKPPGNDYDNTVHSNFGCATAANFAAMIADPRDLLSGRRLGPQVGDPAMAPMHRYRTGKTTSAAGSGDDAGPSKSATITVTPAGSTTQ